MPRGFTFYVNDKVKLSGPLKLVRCVGRTVANSRCSRMVRVGVPYCSMHLLHTRHLRIRPSTVSGAGLGLFAYHSTLGAGEVVFKKNQRIVEYDGERLGYRELQQRYGDFTAPYAIKLPDGSYEDAAFRRGAGALVNQGATGTINAVLAWYTDRAGKQCACVDALQDICNGSEILVDYGSAYSLSELSTRHVTH